MKDKDKERFSQRVLRALDMPIELMPKSTSVELSGKSSAKILGGGAILLYSPEEIRIALMGEEGYIAIRGRALNCNSYNMGAVGVVGRISSVSFESEDGNEKG